jgi:hypothetical protein
MEILAVSRFGLVLSKRKSVTWMTVKYNIQAEKYNKSSDLEILQEHQKQRSN